MHKQAHFWSGGNDVFVTLLSELLNGHYRLIRCAVNVPDAENPPSDNLRQVPLRVFPVSLRNAPSRHLRGTHHHNLVIQSRRSPRLTRDRGVFRRSLAVSLMECESSPL